MAGDAGHYDAVPLVGVRTGEGRTADPCAEGGSQRQRVADVRAALPVVEPPDVAAAGDAVEPPDADPTPGPRAGYGRPRAGYGQCAGGSLCRFLRISNISGRKGHISPEPGSPDPAPGRLRRLGAQEPAEMRHRERDQAPLGAVDEPLLDQPVPGR
jgi:hypothetical protein